MNKFIYNFLSGILIGACMILPGISGSVIAIILGIYEEIIQLFNSDRSAYTKIKRIFPIVFGITIGIFLFGKILMYFYNKYLFFMMHAFIGLILGSVPILKNEIIKKGGRLSIKKILCSIFISVILLLLPKVFHYDHINRLNFINLFVGGLLYISGKIIPGISSSFFLMTLGLYDYLLELITNPFSITVYKIFTIVPFLLGAVLGFVILIKLIDYLLKNYFSDTYSYIIGFIIGSVFSIYPGFQFNMRGLFSCILMFISYLFVIAFSKKYQKK